MKIDAIRGLSDCSRPSLRRTASGEPEAPPSRCQTIRPGRDRAARLRD